MNENGMRHGRKRAYDAGVLDKKWMDGDERWP